MTKTGMEIKTSVLTVTRWSANFPRRMPASIPRGDSDHDFDDDRHESQLDRRREPNRQLVGNRVSVERLAQITLEHIAHVEEVLDHNRLIQVVFRTEGGHVAGRTRSFTAPPLHRIAGQREHHDEDQECRPDDDRNHLQQSPHDVLAHAPLLSRLRRRRTVLDRPRTGLDRPSSQQLVLNIVRPAGQ